jgi:hypothetical protein
MPTPSELVTQAFADAKDYADEAKSQLAIFTNKLNEAIQIAPLVDLAFNPVAEPTAATVPDYVAPAPYTSTLLADLASVLTTRLAGGTGLTPAVETAIWDRAREREQATAQAAIDLATRESEALGYELPPGVLYDAIRRETRTLHDKVSGLSRDIAIKQAELEQSNMQKSIDQVTAFEAGLADIITKRATLSLDQWKALLARFQAEVEQEVKHWEVQIKANEAQMNYILAGEKMNTEVIRANLATVIEAAKTGAQVYSQLTASAYSLIRASAQVSSDAGMRVSFNYSNDTTEAVPPVTAI